MYAATPHLFRRLLLLNNSLSYLLCQPLFSVNNAKIRAKNGIFASLNPISAKNRRFARRNGLSEKRRRLVLCLKNSAATAQKAEKTRLFAAKIRR